MIKNKMKAAGIICAILIGVCAGNGIFTSYAEAMVTDAVQITAKERTRKNMLNSTVRKLKEQLFIPEEIAVTGVEEGEPFFWEGAGIWIKDISLYSGDQCLAGAQVDVDSFDAVTSIYSYDEARVDQSRLVISPHADRIGDEVVLDLAYLLRQPFYEAWAKMGNLQFVESRESESGKFIYYLYADEYVEIETKGSGLMAPITRVRLKGRGNLYNLLGYTPGDSVYAPEEEYEGAGTGEYFIDNETVLVMFYSQADEHPDLDGDASIEIYWTTAEQQ